MSHRRSGASLARGREVSWCPGGWSPTGFPPSRPGTGWRCGVSCVGWAAGQGVRRGPRTVRWAGLPGPGTTMTQPRTA